MNTHWVSVVSDHSGPAGGGWEPRDCAIQRGREQGVAARPALVYLRHNTWACIILSRKSSLILTLFSGMSFTFLSK